MGHIEEGTGWASKQSLLAHRIGVPGDTQASGQSQLGNWLISIHRVKVKIAGGDPLPERDRVALGSGVSRAIGELGKVIVEDIGHDPLAQVVVADVDAAGVDAELEGMSVARPDQIVVDLPLRHLTALGVGIVITADGREGCIVGASCQHDRKGGKHLGIVIWLEHACVPACARVELVDERWS